MIFTKPIENKLYIYQPVIPERLPYTASETVTFVGENSDGYLFRRADGTFLSLSSLQFIFTYGESMKKKRRRYL